MKVIVITPPTFVTDEASIITALFDEGLDYLHLRKPHTSPIESEKLLTLIPETYRQNIVTHDHFYLKEKFNLAGIHLNGRNPLPPFEYDGRLSRSCHSISEVENVKDQYNYVFLSSIYDSISKSGYRSGFSHDVLQQAAKDGLIDSKVIALGGIVPERIPEVKSLGFGGVAILGDIWEQRKLCTKGDYTPLIEHFKQIKQLAER